MIKNEDINNENIDTISMSDILAFKFSCAGSMGENGTIYLLTFKEDLRFYYLNYLKASTELCEKVFSGVLKFFANYVQKTGGFLNNRLNGWKQFYMGAGNYLFIRKKFVKKFTSVANLQPHGIINDYISIGDVDAFLYRTFVIKK